MSDRSMAARYSGGGGGGSAGWYALGDLLARKKLSGGPSIDPRTGEITFTPYQGPGGIFGTRARQRADDMNAEFLGPAYQQQMRTKGEAENIKLKEAEARESERLRQAFGLLAGSGVVPTPGSIDTYSQTINPEILAYILRDQQLRRGALGQPNIEKFYEQDIQGRLQKPFVDNAAKSDITVGPNQTRLFPAIPGLNISPNVPPGSNITAQGPREKEEITISGGIPGPDGTLIGGKPTVTRGYEPGVIDIPLGNVTEQEKQSPVPSVPAVPNVDQLFGGWASERKPEVTTTPAPSVTNAPKPRIGESLFGPTNNPVAGSLDAIKAALEWLFKKNNQNKQFSESYTPYR